MYEIERIIVARSDAKSYKRKKKKQMIDTKTSTFALNDTTRSKYIDEYTNDGMSTLVQKFKNI